MKSYASLVCLAVALACAATAAAAQEQPAAPAPAQAAPGAVDAAKDYTKLMQSAQPADAIRKYWDMDAMLSGIFGEHLGRQTDAERAEMRRLLVGFVEKVYANPAIAAAMKQAQFEDFKSSENAAAGVTAVTFNVRIQDKVLPNTLVMKEADGKWRIQDAGANGRMMVPAIRAEYQRQAQRVTPLQYIQAMVAPSPEDKGK
jgi:ABC-type transporter MlaC component